MHLLAQRLLECCLLTNVSHKSGKIVISSRNPGFCSTVLSEPRILQDVIIKYSYNKITI